MKPCRHEVYVCTRRPSVCWCNAWVRVTVCMRAPGVPAMDGALKRTLHGIISGEIARDPKAPAVLKDYVVSCIVLVRQKTPTVGDL